MIRNEHQKPDPQLNLCLFDFAATGRKISSFFFGSLYFSLSLFHKLHKRGHWGEKWGLEGPIHFIIAEMT
jgi:hypothetical protein